MTPTPRSDEDIRLALPRCLRIQASVAGSLAGEQELMRAALSDEGGFRILLTGRVTAADLDDLISMVTLQKNILARRQQVRERCPRYGDTADSVASDSISDTNTPPDRCPASSAMS